MLYALDGSEIDELGFEPFLRLPTMWDARLDPESGEEGGREDIRTRSFAVKFEGLRDLYKA